VTTIEKVIQESREREAQIANMAKELSKHSEYTNRLAIAGRIGKLAKEEQFNGARFRDALDRYWESMIQIEHYKGGLLPECIREQARYAREAAEKILTGEPERGDGKNG